MFGIFKSKKQRALEMMSDISRGMIIDAINEHDKTISDYDNKDDFCAKSSVAFGEIMLSRLKLEQRDVLKDDIFIIGIFVMGSCNYTTAKMNGDFELTTTVSLLKFFDSNNIEDIADISADTINSYNNMMTSGKTGQALMVQITHFYENSGEEYLEKIMNLFTLMRQHLSS